jgi:hypothetical protein
MPLIVNTDHSLRTNNKFIVFLFSQGISGFGDAFHLIATTALILNITGSGFSAAFGLICSPILSVLFSALAGFISDTKNDKVLLVIVDFTRGVVVFLFIFTRSILGIYLLIVALSILDVLYNPPKRKFMTRILNNSQLMAGNSLLTGLTGGVFVAAPILASITISNYGTDIAFFINSVSFFLSAFFITIIKYKIIKPDFTSKIKMSHRYATYSLFEGIGYCLNSYTLRKIIFIGTIICFATTSVNIAFYPFAFNSLKISNKIWGVMMSIFYGANLLAMPISLMGSFKIKTYFKIIIPLLLIVISVIWFSYGSTNKIDLILFLQLAEGTMLSYLNIILISHIQIKSKIDILGRVIGINDFINNLGKVLGIGCTYTLIRTMGPEAVFLFCAIITSTCAVITFMSINPRKLEG